MFRNKLKNNDCFKCIHRMRDERGSYCPLEHCTYYNEYTPNIQNSERLVKRRAKRCGARAYGAKGGSD